MCTNRLLFIFCKTEPPFALQTESKQLREVSQILSARRGFSYGNYSNVGINRLTSSAEFGMFGKARLKFLRYLHPARISEVERRLLALQALLEPDSGTPSTNIYVSSTKHMGIYPGKHRPLSSWKILFVLKTLTGFEPTAMDFLIL